MVIVNRVRISIPKYFRANLSVLPNSVNINIFKCVAICNKLCQHLPVCLRVDTLAIILIHQLNRFRCSCDCNRVSNEIRSMKIDYRLNSLKDNSCRNIFMIFEHIRQLFSTFYIVFSQQMIMDFIYIALSVSVFRRTDSFFEKVKSRFFVSV